MILSARLLPLALAVAAASCHPARQPDLQTRQAAGVVVLGALVVTGLVAFRVRAHSSASYLTWAATVCIAVSLVIFFMFTYPANQQTNNWTTLPAN